MRMIVVALATLGMSSPLAAAPPMQEVTHVPAADVAAAFQKGRPLLETGGYKIHASRREQAGQAEVHTRDTDVIYVLEGGATIVTGGSVLSPKTIAPEEI